MELNIEKKDGWLRRPYHVPHNAVNPEEMAILLRSMVDRSRIPFEELCNLFFLYQMVHSLFEKFHEKPFKCFSGAQQAPDMESLKKAFGSPDKAAAFAKERTKNFKRFLQGKLSLADFMTKLYKPASTWRRVWSEYARDYIRFATLLKLVKIDKNRAYSLTEAGKKYIVKPESLLPALMEMEVSTTVRKKKISIRPFNVILKVLDEVKSGGGGPVPSQLLMYYVCHMKGDDQLPLLLKELRKSSAKFSEQKVKIESKRARIVQRFGLPIRRFLEGLKLAKESTVSGSPSLSITAKGKSLVNGAQAAVKASAKSVEKAAPAPKPKPRAKVKAKAKTKAKTSPAARAKAGAR